MSKTIGEARKLNASLWDLKMNFKKGLLKEEGEGSMEAGVGEEKVNTVNYSTAGGEKANSFVMGDKKKKERRRYF
eukprot:7460448-Karenia_brevis.AAC.1